MFENIFNSVKRFFSAPPKKKKKKEQPNYYAPVNNTPKEKPTYETNPYFKQPKPFYGERKPDNFLSAFSSRLSSEIEKNSKSKTGYSNVYQNTVVAKDEVEKEYLKKVIREKYDKDPSSVTLPEADFFNGKTNKIQGKTYEDYQYEDEFVKDSKKREIRAKFDSDPYSVTQREADYFNGDAPTPYENTFKEFTPEQKKKHAIKLSNKKQLINEVRANKSKIESGDTFAFGVVDYSDNIRRIDFKDLDEFKDAHITESSPGKGMENALRMAKKNGKKTIVFKNGGKWSQTSVEEAEGISKNIFKYTLNKSVNLGDTFDGFLGDSFGQGLEAADSVANAIRSGVYQASKDGDLSFSDIFKGENYSRAGAGFRDSLLQRKSRGVSDENHILGQDILTDNYKWDENKFGTKVAGFGIDLASGLATPTSFGQSAALRGGKLVSRLTPELTAKIDDEIYERAGKVVQTELEEKMFEEARKNLFANKDIGIRELTEKYRGQGTEEELADAITKVHNIFSGTVKTNTNLRMFGKDVYDMGKIGDKVFYTNPFKEASKNSHLVNRFDELEQARMNAGLKTIEKNNNFFRENTIDEFLKRREAYVTNPLDSAMYTRTIKEMAEKKTAELDYERMFWEGGTKETVKESAKRMRKIFRNGFDGNDAGAITKTEYNPRRAADPLRTGVDTDKLWNLMKDSKIGYDSVLMKPKNSNITRQMLQNPRVFDDPKAFKDKIDELLPDPRPLEVVQKEYDKAAKILEGMSWKNNPTSYDRQKDVVYSIGKELQDIPYRITNKKRFTDAMKRFGENPNSKNAFVDNSFFNAYRPAFLDDLVNKVSKGTDKEKEVFERFTKMFDNGVPKNLNVDDFAKTFEEKVIGKRFIKEFTEANKKTPDFVNNRFFKATDKAIAKPTEAVMRFFQKEYGVDQRLVEEARQVMNERNYQKNQVADELRQLFEGTTPAQREMLTKTIEDGKVTGDPKLDKAIEYIREQLNDAWVRDEPSIIRHNEKVRADNLKNGTNEPEVKFRKNYLPIIFRPDKNKNVFETRKADSNPLSLNNKYGQNRHYEFIDFAKMAGHDVETDVAKIAAKRIFDSINLRSKENLEAFAERSGIKVEGDNARYLDELNTATRNEDRTPLGRKLRGANNNWKNFLMNYALFSSPALRNLYGGTANNYEDSVRISDYIKTLRVMSNKNGKPLRFSDGTEMSKEEFSQSALRQAIDQGQFKGDFVDPSADWDINVGQQNLFKRLTDPAIKTPLKIGGNINAKIEELLRTARYVRGLEDYGTNKVGQNLAGKDVQRAHFNYNAQQSLSKGEQFVKDYLMPFYTFRRFNIPFQLERQVMNPFRANAIRSAERNLDEEDQEDKKGRPITMNNTVKMGDRYYSTAFNPQHDVTDLGTNSLLGMISPFLKAPLEGLGVVDKQIGTGSDLSGSNYLELVPKGMRQGLIDSGFGEFIGAKRDQVKNEDGEYVDGERLLVNSQFLQPLMSMLPTTQRTNKALSQMADEENFDISNFAWQTFGGISNYDEGTFDRGKDMQNRSLSNKSFDVIDKMIEKGKLNESDRLDEQRDIKDRQKAKDPRNPITMDSAYGQTVAWLEKINTKRATKKFGYVTRFGTTYDEYGNIVAYDPNRDRMQQTPPHLMPERVAEGLKNRQIDQQRERELLERMKRGLFGIKDVYDLSNEPYPY